MPTRKKASPKLDTKPDTKSEEKEEVVIQTVETKTPHDIAASFPDHKKLVLEKPFHNGRQYFKGSLVIESEKPIPELNSRADVFVLPKLVTDNLTRATVTVPYENEKTQNADQE